jgi:hypothetical protein
VIPPPPAPLLLGPASADARAEADATNAAAGELGGGAAGGPANDNADPIPPDVLEAMLANGALMLVDVQLQLQAWAIRKRLKVEPGPIPEDSKLRSAAAQAWVAQLKIWIPADKMLPPWALALILPVLCVPQQIATATKLPDEQAPADPVQEAA